MNNDITNISIEFIGPDIQIHTNNNDSNSNHEWKSKKIQIEKLKSEYKALLHNIKVYLSIIIIVIIHCGIIIIMIIVG